MKLYQVSLNADFGDADGRSYWTGSKTDVPKLRKRLVDECHDDRKRHECVMIEVELNPTKAGILDMLNEHATRGQVRN